MRTKIGVIGAMQVEIDLLVARLSDLCESTVADMTIYEGTLGATPVAVVRCGVGKVSAAMCTQALIDRFSPTHIINTGVAGALDASLEIGDLVVASDLVQHDMDVTGLGYEPGVIPELDAPELRGKRTFVTDDALAQAIVDAAAVVAPDATTIRGRIASGDQFVCTQELRSFVIDTFGASCCEMEGAAIAQVCWRNSVPFVVVRAISDKADDTSSTEYPEFEATIANHCAEITAHAIASLG